MAVEISILGELEVTVDDVAAPISSAKQRALLTLLVLAEGRVVSRDRIIDSLWGERPPATAVKNVQVLVARLRDVLEPSRSSGPSVLVTEPTGYRLSWETVALDLDQWRATCARATEALTSGSVDVACRTYAEARSLWRGTVLGSLAAEPWALADAARIEEERMTMLQCDVDARTAAGLHGEVIEELTQLVQDHPRRERFVEQLMLALYRSGRQLDALEVYDRARTSLDAEFALEPGRAVRELQRRILEQDPTLELGPAPTRRARLPQPPVPPTSTIGRAGELEALTSCVLEDQARLVSITGFGGMGKTRLATELARSLASQFEDVGFVELASVASADAVPGAIETAFGISQGDSDPVESIATFLGDRRLLLVLDNFEHVLAASMVVTRLLASCAGLVVVVTTRERLSVTGEREFTLGPLDVPAEGELDDDSRVRASAAVQLFEARAQERGGRRADHGDASTIARICARVDGLPLGIELAAARSRLLSPEEILFRLDRRLALLSVPDRDRTDRQLSLRGAIEWSYDLLTAPEQSTFRMLGVFVGGCTTDAAIQVSGPDTDDIDLIDQLDSLIAKNLVQRVLGPDGAIRLVMLETIAEYASELLSQDERAPEIRSRHVDWVASLAARADTYEYSADDRRARAQLLVEAPNIRAAIKSCTPAEAGTAVEILCSMREALTISGSCLLGAETYRLVADVTAGAIEDVDRARLQLAGAEWLVTTGHTIEAEALAGDARSVFEQEADQTRWCESLMWMGVAMSQRSDPLAAVSVLREARDVACAIYDYRLAARISWRLGAPLEDLGRFDELLPLALDGLQWFEAAGDLHGVAYATMNHGCALAAAGKLEAALDAFGRAVDLSRANGFKTLLSHALSNFVAAQLELGQIDQAIATCDDALAAWQDSTDVQVLTVARSLEAFARSVAGDHKRAVAAAIDSIDRAVSSKRVSFAHQAMYAVARAAELHEKHWLAQVAWMSVAPELIHPEFVVDSTIGAARRAVLSQDVALIEPLRGRLDGASPLDRLQTGWAHVRPWAIEFGC